MSAPTLSIASCAAQAGSSGGAAAQTAQGTAHVAASDERVWRLTAWRWVASDVGAWSTVALLFAAQAVARSSTPFWRVFGAQLASFAPCMLFTPVVAYVALRYRFGNGARVRAAVAHTLCLFAFLTMGSAMMGALEWHFPGRRQALVSATRCARR